MLLDEIYKAVVIMNIPILIKLLDTHSKKIIKKSEKLLEFTSTKISGTQCGNNDISLPVKFNGNSKAICGDGKGISKRYLSCSTKGVLRRGHGKRVLSSSLARGSTGVGPLKK